MGGINHLKSYLYLSKIALKEKDNYYFHLITGQDYLLKSNLDFLNYFNSKDKNLNYLQYTPFPISGWPHGRYDRLEYYNLFDIFNAKTTIGIKFIYRFHEIQNKLNIRKSTDINMNLYGGSTYWSLSRDALEYVISYTNNNRSFFNRFKYTFCAEEIYFQTVLLNSKLASKIINHNLRYIHWEKGHKGSPAFLNSSNYEDLLSSKNLFARKIRSSEIKLLNLINNKRL